jgi:anti-sigma factor RsiW
MNGTIDDIELHAFVDGALDAARFAEVGAAIEADPALAERVAAFQADKAMLKRIYAPIAAQPVPQEWLALIKDAKRPPATSWRLVGSIAAALVIGIVGTLTFERLRPAASGEIVQAALDARATPGAAEKAIAVGASANTHLYDAALRTAVALPVKVPDMSKMGYELIGMRFYGTSAENSAAELLYRGKNGELFTLYLRRSSGKERFDQFERNGLRVCVWQDDEVGTVMAGNVSTAAMQRLASLAYTGLTL